MKVWKAFNVLEEGIMVLGMGIMVFFNFANVVCRYLLPQTPFSYTEELVVLVFVWVSMFGISYGYRIKAHTVLTVVSDLLPPGAQHILVLFSGVASALLMLLIVDTGWGMVMNQLKFGQILPGMKIPVAIVGFAIPLGAAVSFISILKSCFDELRGMNENKGKE